jgi:glycosyltransferase involved in cell wall biosynthesis
MGRGLLLFGINYEPEPTGIALNTTWWSELLAERGWETTVVTGIPHYPSWRPGEVEPIRYHGPVRITHRPHYVPRRMSAVRRGAYELTWVLSSLPELRRSRPDAILGVVPALGGAALASIAARVFRVPYALLFQDVMGKAADLSGMPGASRVARSVGAVELALARRAAGIAIVADGFRPYFLEGGVPEERIHRVRNPARLSPVNEPRESVRERLGWDDDLFVVLHSGSMGFKQGLETVVDAAARAASDPRLRFAFQGDGNQRETLEKQVARRGLRNVQFMPLAPEEDLGSILAAADTLLLNQRGAVTNMSMPAKLASYFAAGVPVLASVAQTDEVAAEVERAEAGIVVQPDDPVALLDGIAALRSDPARARELGAAGARFASTKLDGPAVHELVEGFLESVFPGPSSNGRAPGGHVNGRAAVPIDMR